MLGDIEQEKEAIVAEVEPLRELKTGIDEIAGTGKTVLPGVVAIKKKTLKRSRSRRKPTPPTETKSKRCESAFGCCLPEGAACRSARAAAQ